MLLPRLRQVVLAAADLDDVCASIRGELGLGTPYADPGVSMFGLRNAVFAVGGDFLEVVSPTRPDTAVGRQLTRAGGDCGYMAMVQVADAADARRRLADLAVRVVWDHAEPADEPDVVDLHLHPRDVGGTLLALDETRPTGSWRWGGPDWAGQVPAHRPGGVRGLTVAVDDPLATATRWAQVIGLPAPAEPRLALGDGVVTFLAPDAAGRTGVVGAALAVPDLPAPRQLTLAGVAFALHPS